MHCIAELVIYISQEWKDRQTLNRPLASTAYAYFPFLTHLLLHITCSSEAPLRRSETEFSVRRYDSITALHSAAAAIELMSLNVLVTATILSSSS